MIMAKLLNPKKNHGMILFIMGEVMMNQMTSAYLIVKNYVLI